MHCNACKMVFVFFSHGIHLVENMGRRQAVISRLKEYETYLNHDTVFAVSKLLTSNVKECNGDAKKREGISWSLFVNVDVFRYTIPKRVMKKV